MTPEMEANAAELGHRWEKAKFPVEPGDWECDCGAVFGRGQMFLGPCPRKGLPRYGSEETISDWEIAVTLHNINSARLQQARIIRVAANRIMALSRRVAELEGVNDVDRWTKTPPYLKTPKGA